MKIKLAKFVDAQKLFDERVLTNLLPDRDGVAIEIAGDWLIVRQVTGGRTLMIHGSRFEWVEPAEYGKK